MQPPRVLSVRQPFADLIAAGFKTVELRSTRTTHRGLVLIVAGKDPHEGPMHAALDRDALLADALFGVTVALVTLTDCRPAVPEDAERSCYGGSLEGLYAWCLTGARRVPPMPAKGKLGLYRPDESLADLIARWSCAA